MELNEAKILLKEAIDEANSVDDIFRIFVNKVYRRGYWDKLTIHTKQDGNVRFVKEENIVNKRIKARWEPVPFMALDFDKPLGSTCSNCGSPKYKFHQKYCTDCGAEMEG